MPEPEVTGVPGYECRSGTEPSIAEAGERDAGASARAAVLVLFSCGYFVSYLYRGINIALAPSIMRDTGMDAGSYGLVTSMYFLGFALAQVPAGVLLDRYGPRKVEAALLVVATVGTVVFGAAHGLVPLMGGRFLIGVGVSICLAGAFKALAMHFSPARLPVLYGIVLAVGGFGGVLAGTPSVWLLTVADRWTVCLGMAAFTALAAAALFFGTPEPSVKAPTTGLAEQLNGTWRVLSSRFFWRVAPFSIVSQGTFYATQSLWATTYMEDVGGRSTGDAADLITLVGLAMMAGSVLVGVSARWLAARGIGIVAFSGWCMTVFTLDQIALVCGLPLPGWLVWSLFGLFGPAGVLTYAILTESFPSTMAGRVNTTLTLLLFAAIFLFQWGIGAVLSLWPMHGVHHADVAHRTAWGILILLEIVTSLLYIGCRAPDARLDMPGPGGS